ncbi:MAG: hypothetical protein QXK71_06370 [Pyrobaculum sp.]
MDVLVAASTAGKKKFFIDITHWERVERRYRPFLINSGWPPGLSESLLDIKNYVDEVVEIYDEAVRETNAVRKEAEKTIAKILPLRLILPIKFSVDYTSLEAVKSFWEVKTHLENVVGGRIVNWGRVYAGRVTVEVKNNAVYIGGVPSIGHTYLKLIGVLDF